MKTPVVFLLALLTPVGVTTAQSHSGHSAHSASHQSAKSAHSAQSAFPASFNAVGIYDLDLDMHGQVTSAVLSITLEKDKTLKGTLEVHGQTIELETVTVEDHVVTLASGSELTLTLTFRNDNELLGKWVRSEQSGLLSGTRRKS
jgi:hypothetical protein